MSYQKMNHLPLGSTALHLLVKSVPVFLKHFFQIFSFIGKGMF